MHDPTWDTATDEQIDRACAEAWPFEKSGGRVPRTNPADAIRFCNEMGCEWEKDEDGITVWGAPAKGLERELYKEVSLKDPSPEALALAITTGVLTVTKSPVLFDDAEVER